MNKRGVFFFVIDVLIAVLIFVVTIVVLASFFVPRTSIGGTQQYADVLQEDIFNQQVNDINSDVLGKVPKKFQSELQLRMDELIYLSLLDPEIDDVAVRQLVESLIVVVPEQFGVEYIVDYPPDRFIISRPSSRVAKNDASTKIERKTITIPSQKFCVGPCKMAVSKVIIWS